MSTAPAPLAVGTPGKVRFSPELNGNLIDPQTVGGAVTRLRMWAPGLTRSDTPTVDVGPAVRADATEYDFDVPALAVAGLYLDRVDYTASSSGPAVVVDGTTTVSAFGGSTGPADLAPFATAQDLATRLMVTFTTTQTAAVEQLLADASDFLRDLIGQQVTAGTTTFTTKAPVDSSELVLPQQPARAITSVKVGGQTWSNFELVDGRLLFDRYGGNLDYALAQGSRYGYVDVQVQFTHGITTVPRILKVWTLALASQAFAQIKNTESIGNPGLTSQRLDDWAQNYGAGDATAAWSVPEQVVERLRAKFGLGAYIVGAR